MTQPSPSTPSSGPPRWDGALLSVPVHGRIPALLLAMTAAIGIVDAVSVLGLGRVFVANMTGNIVLLGFAAAGARPAAKRQTAKSSLTQGGGEAANDAQQGSLLADV